MNAIRNGHRPPPLDPRAIKKSLIIHTGDSGVGSIKPMAGFPEHTILLALA